VPMKPSQNSDTIMTDNIIYRMDGLPVQQNLFFATANDAIACPTGNLILVQDPLTGIVHNEAFLPALMTYDENYQNEQGYSNVFEQHLYRVIEIVRRHFVKKSILEIGCGKGRFLKLLRDQGFSVVGIDPAYEGNNQYVVKEPFSPSLGITGEAIVLRHVLEHIPNPISFLTSIAEANGGKGLIYIEVPCLDWIKDHRAWFDLYYEHVNYFRLSDFLRLFGRILDSGSFFGGQYLYVIADLASLRVNPEEDVNKFHLPSDFFDGIDRAIATIKNQRGRKHIIWGGGSKGVIFALQLLKRGGVTPDFVVDINPFKQGKYMPVTGLPVLSPEKGVSDTARQDVIFIMNSNYFDEIVATAGDKYTYYKVDQNEL
jgi:SAM-dependent methyltransferase